MPEILEILERGLPGLPGKSAYQIWLDLGNAGSEQDFLDALATGTGTPGSGVTVHNALTGRDAANAHPIAAIPGLRAELDNKASNLAMETLEVQIVGKASAQALTALSETVAGVEAAQATKLDASAVNHDFTTDVDFVIDGDTVIAQQFYRNPATGATLEIDKTLPLSSAQNAGLMAKEDVSQLTQNTADIAALQGKTQRYVVHLASVTPSQSDLQTAWETASGVSGPTPEGGTLVDVEFDKDYTWYVSEGEWIDRGSASVSQATNTSPGIVQGENTPGKVYVEANATMSLVGWDSVQDLLSALLQRPQGVPVGTIIHFAAPVAPDGYLFCDGAALSRTDFAGLFSVIGTIYGAGDGSTTFNIPDCCGKFDRCWDNGGEVDPGRVFGSSQDSQNLAHTHNLSGTAQSAGSHTHTIIGYGGLTAGSMSVWAMGGTVSKSTAAAGDHTHTLSGTASSSGENESRPINIAFLFCIKY
ncbi:MAG: tail fiber protein [Zoogloeaceae bacterium]|jgi:microcystin-dependent protein|nr:tail fiber protein [Zoogloeaceae bacterium]